MISTLMDLWEIKITVTLGRSPWWAPGAGGQFSSSLLFCPLSPHSVLSSSAVLSYSGAGGFVHQTCEGTQMGGANTPTSLILGFPPGLVAVNLRMGLGDSISHSLVGHHSLPTDPPRPGCGYCKATNPKCLRVDHMSKRVNCSP